MGQPTKNTESLYFLAGDGEAASLIKKFDWKSTNLGNPENWPLSLKTTLGNMLHSAFPMFLFWGEDLICFYNDAYRPSLGNNGKHPAIGKKAIDVFPETWNFIQPLIQKVLDEGTPSWFENMLVPIYRNGLMEDVYWTFSYSPAFNDFGVIEGAIVTITETTNQVKAINELQINIDRFKTIADNIPNLAWEADAQGYIYWYNKKWYDYTGTTEDEMKGWGWKSVHDPEKLDWVLSKWINAIENGVHCEMIFPLKGADKNYRQFLTRMVPIKDDKGNVIKWFGTNTDISDQIANEQAIKESEERFKNMASATDILIATADEKSNASYFNPAWEKFLSKSMHELLNYDWVSIIHPEDLEQHVTNYIASFERRESFKNEYRVMHNTGLYRWLHTTATPRFEENGDFKGYIASSMDITDRKQAQLTAEIRLQEINSLIESSPYPIGVYIGKDMVIKLANQTIIDTWGKGNDVFGKRFKDVLPELDDIIYDQLNSVYDTGIPFNSDNQHIMLNLDGKMQSHYFNYKFTPLFDTNGKVYGVMNTANDVTALNLALLKVAESETSLRNTIMQAPVAMCFLREPNYIVEIANPRMYELWGTTADKVMRKPIFDGLPEAKNQGLEELLSGVYTSGITYSAENVPIILPRNGLLETVYVTLVYEAYREAEGKITGILVVAIDVTAQVLAKQKIEEIVEKRTQELAAANRNLQKSNTELAQFAYIASHDLQEPLRKISVFTEMLKVNLGDSIDENATKYISKIKSSSLRMTQLIRDVLYYSQLINDTEGFENVNLTEILKSVITDFELLIEEKKAKIKHEVLPTIRAIPLQMSQLFTNLISNSLKYSKKDVYPILSITQSKLGSEEKRNFNIDQSLNYVIIKIIDNGIGFNKEYSEQIFHIFKRLHGKAEFEGTGIGLAMCKKIVLNHHGDISAEESSEDGAVFNVVLPLNF